MTVISGGSVVAFSAVRSIDVEDTYRKDSEDSECESQKPLGTPMLVQVSMVTTVVRPMSASQFEAAMEFIKNAKDSVVGLFKWGKEFYKDHEKEIKKMKAAWAALQGVGDIIGGVKKFLPEKDDPMVQALAKLEEDVKALGDKLNEHFAEMRGFISEQNFFTNIISPTSVLTKHMRDCISHPGEDSKRNFQKAYQNMKPLTLQYQLNAYLEQKTTNPLTLSMDAEKAKTKATFEKWEDIISRVMAQFLLLEAFAGGLLGTKSDTAFDRMIEASTDILKDIKHWREEYEKDEGYWNEMKDFLVPYFKNHRELSNEQKGAEIKAKLASYLTRDAFYVCVSYKLLPTMPFHTVCPNEKDQLIVSYRKGGCNCFIYRSRSAYKATQEDYDMMRRKLRERFEGRRAYWFKLYSEISESQLSEPKHLPANGLVAMVSYETMPEILYVNSLKPESTNLGPGYFFQVWTENILGINPIPIRAQVIAAFP